MLRIQTALLVLFILCSGRVDAQLESRPLTIGMTKALYSKILGEMRTINIYLPEDYDKNDSVTYPVIYILDGGMEEDFFHITGIVRYDTKPWIKRFPESIVVGIENTNRKRDFTFPVPNLDFLKKVSYRKEDIPDYGGSEAYITFLQVELQPFIEKKYKANQHKAIIGESLAGLLATEILLKHPSLFDTYIIVSPSLWWGDESLLKGADSLLGEHLHHRVQVCIAAPNKREDIRMYKEAKALYHTLKRNQNITTFFDYLPEEIHSTVLHPAVYNAFKKLYPRTVYSKK